MSATTEKMLQAAEAELKTAEKALAEIERHLVTVGGRLAELESQRTESLAAVDAGAVLATATARGALSLELAAATMAKQELERRAGLQRQSVKAAAERVKALRFEVAERALFAEMAAILKGPLPALVEALDAYQAKADGIVRETGLTPLVLFPESFTEQLRHQLEVIIGELGARRPDLVG